MREIHTLHLGSCQQDLARAAGYLQNGQLVAFPTETVYGLGADATNGTAVARIYEAKGRPSFNPLIVHLPDVQSAHEYVQWNETAEKLADHFWPGALTLVLPLKEGHGLSSLVTAGLPTLAIRIPAHPTAQKLLRLAAVPVAAPSANPSGRISPSTARHVLNGLSGRIEAVVDDGPCHVGLESTILGLTPRPALLRHGGIAQETIQARLGTKLACAQTPEAITAPGQMSSHYAPKARVRLNARTAKEDEVLLGFGAMDCDLNLSPAGDLIEAAANLFGHLHQLDKTARPIAIAPVPYTGLGRAINDRLQRAAAPRPPRSTNSHGV